MKKFPTKFPRYYISEDGRAYRETTEGDIIEVRPHPRGGMDAPGGRYMAINVSLYDDNGKFEKQIRYYVHRLVAETLIENPEGLPEVDHKDSDKTNNAVGNLRWVTKKENMNYWQKRKKTNK